MGSKGESFSFNLIVGQIKAGNEQAVNELLNQFAPLIRNTAFYVFDAAGYSGLEVNDLIAVGNFALYQAALAYDDIRGPFPAYAKLLVRRSVWNYVRENMSAGRKLLNEAESLDGERLATDGLTLADSAGKDDPYLSGNVLPDDHLGAINEYLPFILSEIEKRLIVLRLKGYYPQEIMQALCLSKYRYYEIIDNVRLKMKHHMI